LEPDRQEMIDYVNQARQQDPAAGARLGALSLVERIKQAIKGPRGVNADYLLSVVGAMAGYTAQETVRELARTHGAPSEQAVFTILQAAGGQKFYFGDPLNRVLFELPRSILRLTQEFANAVGIDLGEIPDINELAGHAASTVGYPEFGLIRYPEGHGGPYPAPVTALRHFWPQWREDLEVFCPNPEHWPLLAASAICETISQVQGVMTPTVALRIVLEAAVPMSKVDINAAPVG
jgi:hypothetical protein